MATPDRTDLIRWSGVKITNNDWDANFNQIADWLSDGNADLIVNTVKANSGFDANGGKITNVADGTASGDAVNYSQLLDTASAASAYTIYAVNSAARDANGNADFISKVSDTEIEFDLSENISLTYCDGTRDSLSTLNNITGISADGTYTIYFEKGSGAVANATTNVFTEDVTFPSAPSTGDVHLDLSASSYLQYIYTGVAWELITDKYNLRTKLGKMVKTGGTLGTPVSLALNRLYIIPAFTVAVATTYEKNHNIGLDPKFVKTLPFYRQSSSYTWVPQYYESTVSGSSYSYGAEGAATTDLLCKLVFPNLFTIKYTSPINADTLGGAAANTQTAGECMIIAQGII